MTTKMKGLFKGLRYISHIFEEEKEQDIQIGFPTDVKHVAHIGFDGPAAVESPSWMKDFGNQSAPLAPPGGQKVEPEIKWVSEDSRRSGNHKSSRNSSPGRDSPSEGSRSSRRHHSGDGEHSPKKKDAAARSAKHSRRNQSKDSSEGSVKSGRHHHPPQPPDGNSLPDIPKKSRRKKSKESNSGCGSSRSSRSKATAAAATGDAATDSNSVISETSSIASVPAPAAAGVSVQEDEEKERRVNDKDNVCNT